MKQNTDTSTCKVYLTHSALGTYTFLHCSYKNEAENLIGMNGATPEKVEMFTHSIIQYAAQNL